ncbi:Guanine-hypoxanthine permease [Salmonella sp. FORC89]|nr:Guanine-hypoxanthine permease [Salmonella sp. FORC89]SUG85419.1 Uncharacterised protein [Salmonella enterica subsp. enterica]
MSIVKKISMRSLFAMFFMMERGIMPRFHLLQINAKGNVMCPENENGRPTPPVFQNEGRTR